MHLVNRVARLLKNLGHFKRVELSEPARNPMQAAVQAWKEKSPKVVQVHERYPMLIEGLSLSWIKSHQDQSSWALSVTA